jgi:hypothetical protein
LNADTKRPCCAYHGADCVGAYELCCRECLEAEHDGVPHTDGTPCVLNQDEEARDG